jgi:hypothetical protein
MQISMLWQTAKIPQFLPVSIPLMVASICIYIVAIIKLDELTMPKRFWDEDPKRVDRNASRLAYLEDEDLWQLKKRMIFYWESLTLFATVLTAVSIALMLWPLPPRNYSDKLIYETFRNTLATSMFLIFYFLVIAAIVWRKKRKRFWKPLL